MSYQVCLRHANGWATLLCNVPTKEEARFTCKQLNDPATGIIGPNRPLDGTFTAVFELIDPQQPQGDQQ